MDLSPLTSSSILSVAALVVVVFTLCPHDQQILEPVGEDGVANKFATAMAIFNVIL